MSGVLRTLLTVTRRTAPTRVSRRCWSANSSPSSSHTPSVTSDYRSLQYPLATEPPTILRTKATDVATTTTQTSSSSFDPTGTDPFDDAHAFSYEQVDDIRRGQKQTLSTTLSPKTIPIAPTIPSHVPPNVPAAELATPETLLTTLDNGIRVVSQETYGQVSTVGAVAQVGSRFELPYETGTCNLLEVLGFSSTAQLSGLEITNCLQDWGGTPFVNLNREQSLHCIDLLRPNVEKAVALLAQALLEPQFRPEEIEDAKRALEFQALDMPPELLLGEGLQVAAYGESQQLGQAHFPASTESLNNLSPETVANFWSRQLLHNTPGIVLAGAGVRHDKLVEYADRFFGHMPGPTSSASTTPSPQVAITRSTYRGGQVRIHRPYNPQLEDKDLVRIALALHVDDGWHGDDLVGVCVLQTLLGGGNSFSAGGPGKGMYSRLYRQVLNRYNWAESAEAFTVFYEEAGLWGISGSTHPGRAREMTKVLAEHVLRLASTPVTDEELSRARKMLKNNVLTQLESRLVLFEDMGRQILTYNSRQDMHQVCAKIDAVTADDLVRIAQNSLRHPPTLASVGSNLAYVPQQSEVSEWFP
jgi:processing peptidase subunit alpha